MTEPSRDPVVGILSEDAEISAAVERICSQLDIDVRPGVNQGPTIVDPMVGRSRIRESLATPHPFGVFGVISRPSASAASLFLALRLSRGALLPDPRLEPDPLKHFIGDAALPRPVSRDRRGFPRTGPSGIEVLEPEGATVVDISPYGARIRAPAGLPVGPVLRLRLRLASLEREYEVQCHVAETRTDACHTDLRVRYTKIDPEAQQELFRISKASTFAQTIEATFQQSENGEAEGYRRVTFRPEIVEILRWLLADRPTLHFAQLHRGRVQTAIVSAIDETKRQLWVETSSPEGLGAVGAHVCFTAGVRHRNYVMDGYVLEHGDGIAKLSFPTTCTASDQRAQDRVVLGLDSALSVTVEGRTYTVFDFSSRGFSFYVPAGQPPPPDTQRFEGVFDLGEGHTLQQPFAIRNRRPNGQALTIGATFLESQRARGRPVHPLTEREVRPGDHEITEVPRSHQSEVTRFQSDGERTIVGLWTETEHQRGTPTVAIVPPAWAKTKESTALLAQFLCATFDANARRLAVLRLDYSNTLGESHKDPGSREPGKEALRLTFTGCVQDIRAAVSHACSRFDTGANVVLIGMSFSGPLCLRVAAEDDRVTGLIELMGASDIQDLVRMATGGIDYVNNYRAGMRNSVQNVLGLLSNTDLWVEDGLRAGLVFLQDAHVDASRLAAPLMWIHGCYDGFVNEARVRGVLDAAEHVPRHFVRVTCGHVPTKSAEALASYVPAAAFMLEQVGISEPEYAVPEPEAARSAAHSEWARAPRTRLASPRDYWRRYMLGTEEDSLGFDVLSMTREYAELMEVQARLLAPRAGHLVFDLGGGMGHSLPYLAAVADGEIRVRLMDLVPELLERAAARASALPIELETTRWDAERDGLPAELAECDRVLMSLFLSCLPDPWAFTRALAAVLPVGARVVASSIRPDADLSSVYSALLSDIATGRVDPPKGIDRGRFREEVRDYMNSAAWLLRLADEGTFHLFEERELVELFEEAGLACSVEKCFGSMEGALVIHAEKKE